jgi:hypothetical protein
MEFVCLLSTKSLAVKGGKCTRDKMSKERLTVLWEYGGRNGEAAKP